MQLIIGINHKNTINSKTINDFKNKIDVEKIA